MIGSFTRRSLTATVLVSGAAMLQGCAYDPYTGTYDPCCAYPAYSSGYPAYSYPAYSYPAYSGGVVVGGGWGGGYNRSGYMGNDYGYHNWGRAYRGPGGGGGSG